MIFGDGTEKKPGARKPLLYQTVIGALMSRDYKGVGAQYEQEKKLIVECYCIGNGQVDQLKLNYKVGALNCMHDQQAVIVGGGEKVNWSMMRSDEYKEDEIASTLKQRDYKNATDLTDEGTGMRTTIRRLTELECERLQGFPDGWTDIGEWEDTNGKTHETTATARYKALGNSIATPFWFWLLRRISAQYERPATLGSLFDGIGGFPLCWERCNGKGTAIWASEIEEFPIAVTKRHFPEEDSE